MLVSKTGAYRDWDGCEMTIRASDVLCLVVGATFAHKVNEVLVGHGQFFIASIQNLVHVVWAAIGIVDVSEGDVIGEHIRVFGKSPNPSGTLALRLDIRVLDGDHGSQKGNTGWSAGLAAVLPKVWAVLSWRYSTQ
jgi:hypothetical protein